MDDDEEACNTELNLGLSISFNKREQREETTSNLGQDQAKGRSRARVIEIEEEKYEDETKNSDSNNINENYRRKKLRLSKEQSTLLEDSFKLHTTLNLVQKQALAEKLNLQPRQVEVWFQNRRARTKLKQTEVDCEFLKKCCKSLSEENQRLKKELQELRALKQLANSAPFHNQLANTATLKFCRSCEKINPKGR